MLNENNQRNIILNELAKFYKDKNKSVHITLKSKDWLNGKIISLQKDKMVLMEERFGEMLVLFERIADDGIVPREEKRRKDE